LTAELDSLHAILLMLCGKGRHSRWQTREVIVLVLPDSALTAASSHEVFKGSEALADKLNFADSCANCIFQANPRNRGIKRTISDGIVMAGT
jgi:hypothetical protein